MAWYGRRGELWLGTVCSSMMWSVVERFGWQVKVGRGKARICMVLHGWNGRVRFGEARCEEVRYGMAG